MHILYVTHGYKPAYRIGGPIWSVSAAAEGLVRRGHKVTVFTTDSNNDEDLDIATDRPIMVDGVEVWYFRREDPLKRYFSKISYLSQSMGFMVTPAMKPTMRAMLPTIDVVHTQMPFVYPTQLAGRLAVKAGKPLFYSQRGVFHPERLKYRGLKKRLYIRYIERPIMRRAAGLIALTPDERDSYRALGVETPSHVVPNGIDVEKFRRSAAPGALQDLALPENCKLILFMGRIHPIKGADLLVQAFEQIAERHPEAILALAGPDEHGLIDSMRERWKSRNLSERILALGMTTGERKLDLLSRADLFALPSLGEGLSMAVLEALASGTAVMLSPECNLSVVGEAGAGAVIPREVDRWAETMSRYLSDPTLLETAKNNAYALARDQFSWDPIVDRLEHLYREAADGRAAGRP